MSMGAVRTAIAVRASRRAADAQRLRCRGTHVQLLGRRLFLDERECHRGNDSSDTRRLACQPGKFTECMRDALETSASGNLFVRTAALPMLRPAPFLD
ncbi:hypothetical protein ACFY7B_24420 [Streptomyces albidoflavus]